MAQHWCVAIALPLLWTPLIASPELLDSPQCPIGCSCSFTEWFVRCSNASFSSLPNGLPQATVELDLQFNQLDSLLAASFPDLPELTTLYLGSSRVHWIEAGTFQDVKNLYHLHLDNNLLEEIPEGAFENLTNLVFLHLEHNRIAYLSPGAFSPLKRLSVLDLSHNLLTELSDQALGGLQQLRRLVLSANLIANLSVRALPGSLRILYLDWNRLKSVPLAVCTSATLSSLHLSGNPIRELTPLSFGRKLSSLRQLFLENLHLENITSSTFKRLRRLEVLSLRNNSLASLSSLSSLRYLSTLYLTGNKWHCDCDLIWLRTWQKKVVRKDRNPVECSSPEALQGQQLANIELQKLTCPPFQTDSVTISPSANMPKIAALTTEISSPQAATTLPISVFTTLITGAMSSTIGPTTHNNPTLGPTIDDNHHILKKYDPCLSDHISSISTRTKDNTALVVTWSFSGDHDQFEIRCKSSVEQHVLRVIGGLTEIELHHLQPGTDYRVCIIPQNKNLLECVAPTAQQCTSGHTGAQILPQYSNLFLGIGVSTTLLALMTLTLFAFYRWRFRPIRFQRYYDEDSPFFQQGIVQSKLATESVYDSLEEDDQHVYMTPASQWPEENIDCTPVALSSFPFTPTYASP
ncbi:chondroadherin-like protein [Rhineura floridana]|uniref:chondroadherin-like protein n=1 Tax=Rhineura floridana TaxID=261503 RepID=UPI002AC87189|nr:chondroadherin-like protein [Rhineura floridana]XP_061495239.1 chondroadherin-like protein [Rhineura floridana]XP_061495240.1 chondroadherin-like protein [Rhineura floridana]